MIIFAGNLSFECVNEDLRKLFEGFGSVVSAVIVMRKEKKVPKSRGFGFVEMPDDQQALAAIAGLNGREFMGRAITVMPARPKEESKPEPKPSPKPPVRIGNAEYPAEQNEEKKVWRRPVERRPGVYGGGRRTVNFMKRRGITEIEERPKPRRGSQDNPGRWRKKADQARPWQKRPGGQKPWEKAAETERPQEGAEYSSRPRFKSGGEARPWKRADQGGRFGKKAEGRKPWSKPAGGSKPWKKAEEGAKPWKKAGVEIRKWNKPGEKPKPWMRAEGEHKLRSKSGTRSPAAGRRKPGGYRR